MAVSAVQYTGIETRHIDYTGEEEEVDFVYIDPHDRTFALTHEELTISEETCAGWVTARSELPDSGSEAALLLMQAVMAAMGLHYDYELVKKTED